MSPTTIAGVPLDGVSSAKEVETPPDASPPCVKSPRKPKGWVRGASKGWEVELVGKVVEGG
jgi:hypothetical protein